MTEIELIERIRRIGATGASVELGIGDDCAIYRARGEDLLFTSDQVIEDVHFRRDAGARVVGERALARGLSDIAAMGGTPRFCLVSLAVPARMERWVLDFYRGLMGIAKRTGAALAGGDLARAEKIYCDVMVCGSVARGKALRRDGARVGDRIYVSGRLGKPWDRKIEPRLELGRKLIGVASACMDLSDGLSLDLKRLAMASGVAAEVDRVPVARGSTAERALHGGEDYELLFTVPRGRVAPRGGVRIGRVVEGPAGVVRFGGKVLEARGWDHFGGSAS